jgi:uncharacterized MAPEG superfamily protein
MRLPKNPKQWTEKHAGQAIAAAHAAFNHFEAHVDFDAPKEAQDALYQPYRVARAVALQVARATGCKLAEADALP